MRSLKYLSAAVTAPLVVAILQGCGFGINSSLIAPLTTHVEAATRNDAAAGRSGNALGASDGAEARSNRGTLAAASSLLPIGHSDSLLTNQKSGNAGVLVSSLRVPSNGLRSTFQDAAAEVSAALAITTPTLGSAQLNAPYQAALAASGGRIPYVWTIVAGSLPAGVSLNTAGVLAGTPTQAGYFNFTVASTDSSLLPQVRVQRLRLWVAPLPLSVVTTSLAGGTKGSAYSAQLNATGGSSQYTWSVSSGSLPGGLALGSNGAISGTPTASGSFAFEAAVADSGYGGQRQTRAFNLKISAAMLTIQTSSLGNATLGQSYKTNLVATGGTPNYTWFPAYGKLPAGITLKPSGELSGASTELGTYSFALAVMDSGAPKQAKLQKYSLRVAAAPVTISTAGVMSAEVGKAYAATLSASGGTGTYKWSVVSGSLPTGLSINAVTGAISGTPTTSGGSSFLVSVSDTDTPAQTAAAATSITVAAAAANNTTAGTTWYVRPDGGTRFSSNALLGQCDGKSDAAYPGYGFNQHCAFNQAMFLWSDGTWANGPNFPAWGWIGSGGDTYIIRGSMDDGVTYRIGWNNAYGAFDPGTQRFWGLAGDPYSSGIPVPLAGTPEQPTRILGGNYDACTTSGAKTQLHGGYGVYAILNLAGASNVQVKCIDATDFSSCSKLSSTDGCNRNIPLSDFATVGIQLTNTTRNVLIQDVAVHGLGSDGVRGPTGDGVVMNRISIRGNPDAGWNADDGTTGSGTLLVQNFDISWNGCSEEYPIVDSLPYNNCLDDGSGGYGDGFGTATLISNPGWKVTFDTGVVSYNTQDGLDALHLLGNGSSITVNRVLAYGNMGQQIKVGGAAGTATNNLIVTSCTAMSQAIPGTPAGFNTSLSDFCRAANTGVVMTVGKGSRTVFDNNTIYSNAATAFEVECDTTNGACDSTAQIEYRDNIFLGFTSYNGDYSNPIYVGASPNPFTNAGSTFDHNVTYHAKSNWSCPATRMNETNAVCADPGLVDESWHAYGYGDMSPTSSSIVKGVGAAVTDLTVDYTGAKRSSTTPSIGAYE